MRTYRIELTTDTGGTKPHTVKAVTDLNLRQIELLCFRVSDGKPLNGLRAGEIAGGLWDYLKALSLNPSENQCSTFHLLYDAELDQLKAKLFDLANSCSAHPNAIVQTS